MPRNKAHLLLVDDDKRILSLLSAYLSKNEFLISSARNSIEARCLLDYFEFDLLVIRGTCYQREVLFTGFFDTRVHNIPGDDQIRSIW